MLFALEALWVEGRGGADDEGLLGAAGGAAVVGRGGGRGFDG